MRADLEDAYAAIDWANSQLPLIEQEIETWKGMPPYEIVAEDDLAIGKKLLRLRIIRYLPPTLNAAVGACINSFRTSLDLLASALAVRSGKSPSSSRHFPFAQTAADFMDPKRMAERKKWLGPADLTIIEAAKPYRGGNDFLYALHQLDILRKHERLLRFEVFVSQFSMDVAAAEQGFERVFPWPGFEEDALIGRTNLNATSHDLQLEISVLFHETSFFPAQPIVPLLRQLRGTAHSVVQRFE
ncbi:MAG: hypothetical protein ACHQK9_01495 [Reyranellales bacterium]